MARTLTASVLSELVAAGNRPVTLTSLHFDAGVVYLNDTDRALSWGGNAYLGAGNFVGVADLAETTELEVSRIRLALSGVDQTMISQLLNEQYIGRQVLIYQAYLDASGNIVTDPFLIFDGVMDDPVISDTPSGASTLAVVATNTWADWSHPRGRHTNSAEQQILFPGDLGFDFASQSNLSFTWGRHVNPPPPPPPPPPKLSDVLSTIPANTGGGGGGHDSNPSNDGPSGDTGISGMGDGADAGFSA